MKVLGTHIDGAGSSESFDAKGNDAGGNAKQLTMRDRWETVRYGRVGRILGYIGAFAAIFVVITLLLWLLESHRW